MSTQLVPVNQWINVEIPNPAEPVRAGGGLNVPITLMGANANSGVRYVTNTAGVRVRHLGGINKVLDATLSGLDVTIQLGTDGAGVVTSTATAVVNKIAAVPAVDAVLDATVTGDGTGMAGIWEDFTAIAGSLTGSIRPPFQQLTDRTQWLKENVSPWAPPARFFSLGGNNEVTIGGLTGHGIIQQGADAVVALAGLGNNQWRYVYAYVNSGAVAFESSTTAPTADLVYKTGDTTRRYVGTIRTDGSANILSFISSRGNYRYTGFQSTGTWAGLNHTTWTEKALLIPPHARMVQIIIRYKTLALGEYVSIRPKGFSSAHSASLASTTNSRVDLDGWTLTLATSTDQKLEAKEQQDTAGNGEVGAATVGWIE